MLVPRKSQKVNDFPDNYKNVLKLIMSLRKTAPRDPNLDCNKFSATNSVFTEFIAENWIEPAKENVRVCFNSA